MAEPQEHSSLNAWLLPIGGGVTVALGRYQLKYIEYPEQLVTLPGLPAYCEQGFIWREQFVPILNLLGLATRRRLAETRAEKMVAVVAYEQAGQSSLGIGALNLEGPPQHVTLAPDQAEASSQLDGVWALLASAAFRTQDSVYPVLNLEQLFNTAPQDLLKLH